MEQNKEPEIDPHTHAQMTFDKYAKAIQWKRDILFIKWCLSYCVQEDKMNLDLNPTPYTKNECKMDHRLKCKM